MTNTKFNPLTQTYDTIDGTKVSVELCDTVTCIADVLVIANIREQQREQQKEKRNDRTQNNA